MVTFPFYCPACQKVANAKADPVGLLFGGAADFTVECEDCEAKFRAVIEQRLVGPSVSIKERLPDEPSE